MSATRLFDRAIIRLSPQDAGEDVRSFLQGLVTQDCTAPLPLWAGLLTPQGKALFDFIIWADGEDILLDCEAGQADALVRRLSIYRLRRKIAIAVDVACGIFWLEGSGNDPRLAKLGERRVGAISKDDVDVSREYLKNRLSLGVAEGVAELGSDQTLWLECNAAELSGVSFSKGCYVGQENTARMNWRQKVNRRLVVVPQGKADQARTRIFYPEFGLSVAHMRVEDITSLDLPEWQDAAVRG